jgi:hypothetical protein
VSADYLCNVNEGDAPLPELKNPEQELQERLQAEQDRLNRGLCG